VKIADLLDPRCPNHPDYRIEDHGYCCVCELTTHRHLTPSREPDEETKAWIAKLAYYANQPRVTYRSEAETFDEGIYDDD
jgi:hypothetical protein